MDVSKRVCKKMNRVLRPLQGSTALHQTTMNLVHRHKNHNRDKVRHGRNDVVPQSIGPTRFGLHGRLTSDLNFDKSSTYDFNTNDDGEEEEVEDIDLEFVLNNSENKNKCEKWCKDEKNKRHWYQDCQNGDYPPKKRRRLSESSNNNNENEKENNNINNSKYVFVCLFICCKNTVASLFLCFCCFCFYSCFLCLFWLLEENDHWITEMILNHLTNDHVSAQRKSRKKM